MFKAAIKREENDARINYPERKQARNKVSMFNEIKNERKNKRIT